MLVLLVNGHINVFCLSMIILVYTSGCNCINVMILTPTCLWVTPFIITGMDSLSSYYFSHIFLNINIFTGPGDPYHITLIHISLSPVLFYPGIRYILTFYDQYENW